MKVNIRLVILRLFCFGGWSYCLADAPEPGLLFYLSGEHGFAADHAASGDPQPNFLRDVKLIAGGARGQGFECANTQLMSYWAPGNIYAERGTLSFYWRSRYAVGVAPPSRWKARATRTSTIKASGSPGSVHSRPMLCSVLRNGWA